MARIRGLIRGHIGMIELIEALLVALDWGLPENPNTFFIVHTLFTLHLLALHFLFALWLLSFISFKTDTLHHYITHIVQTHFAHSIPLLAISYS